MNLLALYKLDSTASLVLKSLVITLFGFADLSVVRNLLVSENRKLNEFRNCKMTLYFIFFWFLSTCGLSLKF